MTGDPLNIWMRTLVIASGPRIIDSTMGPIPSITDPSTGQVLDGFQQATQLSQLSFTVTYDRPINPPSGTLNGVPYTTTPSFTPADVQVFYHDTTNGDASIPVLVTGVTPVASSGVGPDSRFGFTQFKITFDPTQAAGGGASGIQNFTGTYSYIITPDDGQGTPIVSPIASFANVPAAQPVIGPVASNPANSNLPIPISSPVGGTGGTGTTEDDTISTITLAGHPNQLVTGVTVNLSINHTRDGDLTIELVAPNGDFSVLYFNPSDNGQNLTNTTFTDSAATSINAGTAPYTGSFQPYSPLNALNGSAVNGVWELFINDGVMNNVGTLLNWSITVDSSVNTFQVQYGAPMDQNADGVGDQNPLTSSITGLTPGDVYAVPTPQPIAPVTFSTAASILSPPFDQNTLPLIVSGPQLVAQTSSTPGTSVPGGNGNNLVTDGTVSSMNVTFDRPMQVSTFTPGQVLGIMGPTGSLTAPQDFPSDFIGQAIPAATSAGAGTLDSTLTVASTDNTFLIQDISVQINAAFPTNSALTAVLVSPNGTTIPLFSGVGGSGANFVNTVFNDSATASIASGTAPFTGTFRPEYPLNPTDTLTSLDGTAADGVWHLMITNTLTGATGTLDSWSLSIKPVISVTPVDPQTATINGSPVQVANTFTIGFPQQQLSGTYTIQIAPGIQDEFGDLVDTSQNAGLDVLRGQSQDGPTTTVHFPAPGLPSSIPAPTAGSGGTTVAGTVSSSITIPDNFMVQGDTTSSGSSGLQVQLNITYANDPDLSATLYYDYNGPSQVAVPLFSGVGGGSTTANFNNTKFDDLAGTPIQNGAAPFFGTFNPQMSLAAFAGLDAKGTWTLVITNSKTGSGGTGTLNSWSLTFQKPVPTTGLGEPNSDNIDTSFRIFNLGQADAVSSQQWTAVGPASIGGGGGSGGAESSSGARSGRVGGLAVDPSDPTGNTVYVAGASGGVWKTTNFLTTNPAGPTYIPLTNFGPSFGVNIGSLTVLGRNHDTNQSIIIAATGEGDTGSPGVGFLISTDGGATWNLMDSTDNVDSSGNILPIESASRNREFVGSTSFKVVVDPQLTPSGQAIIYAALSGTNGGIWRSEDTGKTWQNMLPGQATDVVLDPESGNILNPDTDTLVQGNLQVVYGAIRGVGIYLSPNQGQVWNQMLGGIGNPLIDDLNTGKNVNPTAGLNPNGAQGRIVLAVPTPTGNAAADAVYEGWLYATVSTPAGALDGIFVTKDFGQNWTQVRIPTLPPETSGGATYNQAIPSNNVSQPDYPLIGSTKFPQGNYNIAMAVDPTNPNIIYVGGTADGNESALIRVDLTTIWDAHNLQPYSDVANDNGALDLASKGPAPVDSNLLANYEITNGFLDTNTYLNYIRSPQDPFLSSSTLQVFNFANFTNNGAGVEWIPFDAGGTDYHKMTTMIDPTTGLPRLIVGNDQGVYSILDNNGTFETQVGSSDQLAGVDRNGNLQITQFYYGAAQPSSAAAQIAGALFYGSAQDDGGPVSGPNLLSSGDITWSGPQGDAGGVATNPQGDGSGYQYWWGCCGGQNTNFFQYIQPGNSGQVNGSYVGRTSGLLQASNGLPTPDPQWPFGGGANFAVNQANGNDVVITSGVGRIFTTSDGGVTWFDVGDPAVFGSPGSFSNALAYGAPDPSAPEGLGNLGNFIYVGTATGKIYMTQDGGGSGASNNWLNISLGLDGSTVESIITDPTRGSHDAYAVTSTGVFYIQDSVLLGNNPTNTAYEWVNITGNIHNLAYTLFGQTYNPTTDPNSTFTYNQAQGLTAIVADWRYQIPNNTANLSLGYHPVLYVAGNSGVYQSLDQGKTWSLFPSTTFGASQAGGYLPHVSVSSLSLSLGNINPNTGMPTAAGPFNPSNPTATPDPDVLMAATYGQGEFAINLAPMLFPTSVGVASADTSGNAADGTPIVTTAKPTLDGSSEITKFGNATWVTIVDETPTDPNFGKIIGGFDPSTVKLGQAIPITAGNSTDGVGNFAIPITTAFGSNGLKTIELFTTDNAGAESNKVTLTFTLQATDIAVPPPTTAPAAPVISIVPKLPVDSNGNPVTNLTNLQFAGTTVLGTFITVTETWTDAPGGPQTMPPFQVPASDINSDGTFNFNFQDFLDSSGDPVTLGTFTVVATATYSKYPQLGQSDPSNTIKFDINNTTPIAVTNLHLNPATDTGIVGDNITTDRMPSFVGTTTAGYTVELFVNGQPAVQNTTTADSNGNFSIQLPFNLNNGQTSVYVEVINQAGNTSLPSNSLGLVITSTDVSYNGTSKSDPALFSRNTTTNQLQWLVQTLAGPPPWFGPSGTAYSSPTGTANVVPFQGDFDGDGVTDLAYYNTSTATWTIAESSNYASQGAFTFSMGTPNSSLPVVGYFSPNGAQVNQQPLTAQTAEPAVLTYSNGQDVWTIASSNQGNYTVTFPVPGMAGDIPVPGDYDGVGYDQLAVYRPSTAQFLVLQQHYNSSTGTGSYTEETIPLAAALQQFGLSGDLNSLVPVPAQYDNVAIFNALTPPAGGWKVPIFGHTEAAVYDPAKGTFLILGPNNTPYTVSGYQSGDIPAPADYLGTGQDQVVAYRPSTGQFIQETAGVSAQGTGQSTIIGTLPPGGIPVMAPLSYRLPGVSTSSTTTTNPSGTSSSSTSSSSSTTTTTTSPTSTTTTSTNTSGGNNTGTNSSTTTTTTTTSNSGQSGQNTTTPVTVHSSKHSKKVVTKKAHPTKKPVKTKKVTVHAKNAVKHTAKKVHVAVTVHHGTGTVAETATSVAGHTHLIDLALAGVHVNLRSSRKNHGA